MKNMVQEYVKSRSNNGHVQLNMPENNMPILYAYIMWALNMPSSQI